MAKREINLGPFRLSFDSNRLLRDSGGSSVFSPDALNAANTTALQNSLSNSAFQPTEAAAAIDRAPADMPEPDPNIIPKEYLQVLREIGATGTQIFSGFITKDYNAKLTGREALAEFDKMRLNDGQVQACLLAMKLPLLAAPWRVDPASDDDVDKEIADWIEGCLFDRMSITWEDTLRQVLLLLDFGFSNFEKVFRERDGFVELEKLAPRLPTTSWRWILDPNMNLTSWIQMVVINNGIQYREIPVDKLVMFTYNQEGQNFEGRSVLRSAWKHWMIKDNLYRIANVGAERNAVGLPTIKLPPNPTDADKAAAKTIGQSVRAHEKAFVALPSGFEFKIEPGQFEAEKLLSLIKHHDSQIGKSMLAQFIDLGQESRGGSYALSQDQSDFFLMALNALSKKIEDTMNRFVVKQLVDYNYSGVKEYPKLRCGEIGYKDKKKIADTLQVLTSGGVLHADQPIEAWIRDLLGLPEMQDPLTADQSASLKEKKRAAIRLKEEKKWRRDLTPYEKRINLAEIDKRFSTFEDKLTGEGKLIVRGQSEKLVKDIGAVLESGNLAGLRDIAVGYQGKYADTIKGLIGEMYQFGKSQVYDEWKKKGGDISQFLETWASNKAVTVADYQASQLKSKALFAAIDGYGKGRSPKEILWDVRSAVEDFANKDLQGLASATVGDAINEGRFEGAQELMDEGAIDRAQFSAILDGNTCPLCEKLDGMVISMDDPEYDQYTPPIHGGCRCIWAYIGIDDTTAVVDWKTPPDAMEEKYHTK